MVSVDVKHQVYLNTHTSVKPCFRFRGSEMVCKLGCWNPTGASMDSTTSKGHHYFAQTDARHRCTCTSQLYSSVSWYCPWNYNRDICNTLNNFQDVFSSCCTVCPILTQNFVSFSLCCTFAPFWIEICSVSPRKQFELKLDQFPQAKPVATKHVRLHSFFFTSHTEYLPHWDQEEGGWLPLALEPSTSWSPVQSHSHLK